MRACATILTLLILTGLARADEPVPNLEIKRTVVHDRGVIKPGMLADLIAVRGNPLEDVTVMEDVPFVMIAGRVVESPGTEGGPVE